MNKTFEYSVASIVLLSYNSIMMSLKMLLFQKLIAFYGSNHGRDGARKAEFTLLVKVNR